MPTYGYECLSCHDQFEVFQSIKDAPMATCEKCGGTLRKRIYPVGIAFKGSGFFVNDYAAKSETRSDSAPKTDVKSESTPAAPATETKADANPKTEAPKAETKSEKAAPATV
jgi:putative FmdB family regulatory protein